MAEHTRCDEIKKLAALWPELEKWKKGMELKVEGHDKSIREVAEFQASTKVYVTEIKNQIDRLESRLFTFMDGLVQQLTSKEKAESKQNVQTTDKWISLLKFVLGGTIFIIVAYFFGKSI